MFCRILTLGVFLVVTMVNAQEFTSCGSLYNFWDSITISQVVFDGERAFIAGGAADIQIFDISNPEEPEWLGVIGIAGEVWNMAIDGNRASILTHDHIYLYDIEDINAPEMLSRIDIDDLNSQWSNNVILIEDALYFGNYRSWEEVGEGGFERQCWSVRLNTFDITVNFPQKSGHGVKHF